MQKSGIKHFVGVFDARMVRIYRMIGASPDVLGCEGEGRDQISVGLWAFDKTLQAKVSAWAGISSMQSHQWFEHSFGAIPALPFAKVG